MNHKININPITTLLTDISNDNKNKLLLSLFGENVNYQVYQTDFYNECSESSSESTSCKVLQKSIELTTLKNIALSTIKESGSQISTADIIINVAKSIEEIVDKTDTI